MTTLYLKITPQLHEKYKSRVVSNKAFDIIRDLKGKPLKTKEEKNPGAVLVPEEGDPPGFYTKKPKKIKDKDGADVGTTEQCYPEIPFQGKIVGTLVDNSVIVHAMIPMAHVLAQTHIFLTDQEPDLEDLYPLTPYNMELLGITQVVGYTRQDVFDVYPELEGQEQIGINPETGDPIMADKLMKHKWSCEV